MSTSPGQPPFPHHPLRSAQAHLRADGQANGPEPLPEQLRRGNAFQKQILQNYFPLQPMSVRNPSTVTVPFVLGLGIPHGSGHCQGEAVVFAPSISCQEKDLHI